MQRDRTLIRDLLDEIERYSTRNAREREERVEAERRRQHEAQHAHLAATEAESAVLTAGLSPEATPPSLLQEEEEEKEVDPSLVGSLDDVYANEPAEIGASEDPFQRMPVMQDKEKPTSLMEMEKSMDALAVYAEQDGDVGADETSTDRGTRSGPNTTYPDESSTDRGVRVPGGNPLLNSISGASREAIEMAVLLPSSGDPTEPPGDPDELPDLVGVSPNDLPPDALPTPFPAGHAPQPLPVAPDVATGTAPTPDLAVGMAMESERVVDLLDEGADPLSRVVDLTAGLASEQQS